MSPANFNSLADANKSQLVVVDVQSRLLQTMHDPESLLHQCDILIRAAKLLGIPVIVTEQYPKGIGKTDPGLTNTLDSLYQPVEKTCFSCCGASEFTNRLQQHPDRNQIILCGIEAHVCVLQTAMDLLRDNASHEVFVVGNAVTSRNKKNKKIAINRLNKAGAIISCTESVLFEWLKNSKHEHFKQISALIK